MRAADAPLSVPDGARPPLQLRDLVNEADALDERPALPAPAARSRALGHLLTGGAAKEGKQSQEQCEGRRRPHGCRRGRGRAVWSILATKRTVLHEI